MPREKTTRNPLGTILKNEIVVVKFIGGKEKKIKQTVYDARKRYTDQLGKKKQKFKRCYSYSEATTALTNFANEIAAEIENKSSQNETQNKTFLELTEYYRKNYLIPAVIVRGRLVEGYRSPIKKLENMVTDFEEFFGNILLTDFNYELIRKYSIHLSKQPKKSVNATEPPKPATINRKLALLRKIFNVGVQLQWRPTNPCVQGKSLIIPSAEEHRSRALTYEEERRLIQACTGDIIVKYKRKGKDIEANMGKVREHLIPIIIMAVDTGMRSGEIKKLERSQINFKEHTISLRAEQTKALKPRTIPMSDRLENALKNFFANNFVPRDEKVFGPASFRKSFESAVSDAGIDDFTFHDLRHTAITNMDEAGISESVRKNIVGHSDGNVHQRYNNLTPDTLLSAKRKIDAFRSQIDSELDSKVNAKVNA